MFVINLYTDIIVRKMCCDSKVVDDPKGLSLQLNSSEVNIFCIR